MHYFIILLLLVVSDRAFLATSSRSADNDRPVKHGIQKHIIEGDDADEHQFPWHVNLSSMKNNKWFICGGSLISPNYILTAAHCLLNATRTVISFGIVKPGKQQVEVKNNTFKIHPDYLKRKSSDIALIKLPQNIPINNSTIKVLALAPKSLNVERMKNLTVTISGFGIHDKSKISSKKLKYTSVNIIPRANCDKLYKKGVVSKSTICAVPMAGTNRNICQGDSGGALVAKYKGTWVQIGIVSFSAGGDNGCFKGLPSGFVNVVPFLKWIARNSNVVIKN